MHRFAACRLGFVPHSAMDETFRTEPFWRIGPSTATTSPRPSNTARWIGSGGPEGLAIGALDSRAGVRPSYLVTTTISSKGQMVIPRQVRERLEIRAGDDFLLLELANGDLLLRRSRPPRRSLAWHLRRMRGLELERNRERVRGVAS